MKCTFALLVNDEIHNYIRKKVVTINRLTGCGFFASQLPPHISLKQPFIIDDIDKAEKYFNEFSKKIQPIRIIIDSTYNWENIIGLNVVENAELRNAHNILISDLKEIFRNSSALHDGNSYHFHATISMGGMDHSKFKSGFIEAYEKVKDANLNFEFMANKIVMFYNDDDKFNSIITYKINEIGK